MSPSSASPAVSGVFLPALLQLGQLGVTGAEHFTDGRGRRRLAHAPDLVEAARLPEGVLELGRARGGVRKIKGLRADDEPRGDRHQDQQRQDALHDRGGVQEQRDDVEPRFAAPAWRMSGSISGDLRGWAGRSLTRPAAIPTLDFRGGVDVEAARARPRIACRPLPASRPACGRRVWISTGARSKSAGWFDRRRAAPSPTAAAPTRRSPRCGWCWWAWGTGIHRGRHTLCRSAQCDFPCQRQTGSTAFNIKRLRRVKDMRSRCWQWGSTGTCSREVMTPAPILREVVSGQPTEVESSSSSRRVRRVPDEWFGGLCPSVTADNIPTNQESRDESQSGNRRSSRAPCCSRPWRGSRCRRRAASSRARIPARQRAFPI